MSGETVFIIDGKTLEDIYNATVIEFFERDKSLQDLETNIISSVCSDFFFKAVGFGFDRVYVLSFIKEQIYGLS